MQDFTISSDKAIPYDVASHGDYHIFSFQEKYFLFDINNVNVYEIDERLFYELCKQRTDSRFFEDLILALQIKENSQKTQIYTSGVLKISLNVAQVCNLSCVYCYGVDGEYGTKGKMTEETAIESVDFLMSRSKKDANVVIHFFGGEPLLNFPLVKKVVKYSSEQAQLWNKKLSFAITTNGTKFSDEVNSFLNQHNFSVTVSFDGDEDIQDKNRPFKNGKGSFSVTKPKIDQFLRSRNGNACARATVTNHSHDLLELKKRLRAMGFKNATATVATLSNYAIENRPVSDINESQKFNMLQESDSEAQDILHAVKNRDRAGIAAISDSRILMYLRQLQNKNKQYFSCGVGRGLLAISITGDIYPCHRFVGNEEFKMGNISTYDNNSANKYSTSPTQTHPVCSKCWAKYQCGGAGCIHDNYVTQGDINNINIDHCTRLKNNLKNAAYIFSMLNKADKEFLFGSQKK